MAETTGHTWRFFRAGGFDQVRIETGADIANLGQLDQKLWVALACPTRGIEFDPRTLDLIDTDKDGRVRAPEVIAAAKWACSMVKNPDVLVKGSPALSLDAINDATPEGKQLLASAKHVLDSLGKSGATAISVEDTADSSRIFAGSKFNGDGVVTPDSCADAETRQVVAEIGDCLGTVIDRGGRPGINADKLNQFFADARAYVDWRKTGDEQKAGLLPFGADTAAASSACRAVKAKVDDYFARCRLAAFDGRAAAVVNRQESEYQAFAAKEMTITGDEVAGFPLAKAEAGKPLPLKDGLNPAWAGRIAEFATAVKPLLGGRDALTFEEWTAIGAKFAAFDAWQAAKPGAAVEKLGVERLQAVLAGKAKAEIAALIAEDLKREPEAAAIAQVDKLVRLNRDLCKLLNNFVSFRDFYARKDKAVFQAGTLYLDGRSCDLCVGVADPGKHAALAAMAKTYLAYCDCTRPSGEKMQIAAAFTGGDSDNLMIGRNGVFYDRQGRDWDATVTKIVDNPISIRQAFWAPYKKCLRMIEEQIAKRAAAADANASAKLQATTAATVHAGTAVPAAPPPPPPPAKKVDPGMLAAIGLVLATLLAALGGIFGAFVKLPVWQMPLAILAILLAISIPSMIIAWLKLRQRNLGPILDANGWAVNARAKINVPFGGSLTKVAALPANAERSMSDPYAPKRSPWPWIILVLVLLVAAAWFLNSRGYIHRWTGYGKQVPAVETPKPPVPAAPAAPTAPPPAA
jgi:hypothetical protein